MSLLKAHMEIDDCQDILKGHCKEYEPHTNGFFLSAAHRDQLLEALQHSQFRNHDFSDACNGCASILTIIALLSDTPDGQEVSG